MPFLTQEEYINSKVKFRFGGYLASTENIVLTANTPVKVGNVLDVQVSDPLKNENVALTNGLITNDTGYKAEISAKIGVSLASTNPGLDIKLRGVVNTVTDGTSEIIRTIGTGNDKGAVPLIYTFIVPIDGTLDFEIESTQNTTITFLTMTFDFMSKKIFLP